ncbi:hypothetical protein ACVVHK_005257, partial [Escherichia coli]
HRILPKSGKIAYPNPVNLRAFSIITYRFRFARLLRFVLRIFCALFEVVYPPASRVISGFALLVCVIDFVIGFMIDLRTFLRIFQGIFQRIFSGIFTPFDATCKGL